jgi:sigma-B regulation protein RsbU (phosphoserine phosphatase)
MEKKELDSLRRRLRLIPAAGILINIAGATFLFIYFAFIEPGTNNAGVWELFRERVTFFVTLFLIMMGVVFPINGLWIFFPVLRDFGRVFSEDRSPEMPASTKEEEFRGLAARALGIPVKVAITVFSAWVLCGLSLLVTAHYLPGWFPWDRASAHKMFYGIIFVAAPVSVTFIFFVEERLIRGLLRSFFPRETLKTAPGSLRIRVLPRILFVTIMLGTMPVSLICHEVLHRVGEIQAGRLPIESFLSNVTLLIFFLLAWSVVVAVGLSILTAHSFADPLRHVGAAMEEVGRGDLNVSVPVVSNDEIGSLTEGFNLMVDDYRRLESVRDTFGRYLSEEVVSEILESPEGVRLGGELREITILVSDLRGFTKITDSLEPRAVLETINRYFERMTDIIVDSDGTIDEFTGDGILVFFGAPRSLPDHPDRAVTCALRMQRAMDEMNRGNVELGLPELRMGIGINTGSLIVGNIGSEKRKKYGAVGSPINVAFRVEGQTSGGEVLVTKDVFERLTHVPEVSSTRDVLLKGFGKPITIYEITVTAG